MKLPKYKKTISVKELIVYIHFFTRTNFLLFFSFVLFFFGKSTPLNSQCKKTQITINNTNDQNPKIHNGVITWERHLDMSLNPYLKEGSDIFFYDTQKGGSPVRINNMWTDILFDEHPQIHNGIITWCSYLNRNSTNTDAGEKANNEFVLSKYNTTTNGPISWFTLNPYLGVRPQIHNDLIVWSDYNLYGVMIDKASERTDYEIYLYQPGIGTSNISNNSKYIKDTDPQIHNGVVVWHSKEPFKGSKIYHYKIGDSSPTQIPNNAPNTSDITPQIHNNLIVWERKINNNSDIYISDISKPSVDQISHRERVGEDRNPQIHNGVIVWEGFDGNDWEIFMDEYPIIPTQNPIRITDNSFDDVNPKIHDGIITWERKDGNSSYIFMYDIARKDNVEVRISDTNGVSKLPQIHNGVITWQQKVIGAKGSNSNWEIFICECDGDGDGVKDWEDNCPLYKNMAQRDMDEDGKGDWCDDDIDGDGITNIEDNCESTVNPDQMDTDNDGKGDVCDSYFPDNHGIPKFYIFLGGLAIISTIVVVVFRKRFKNS